VSTIDTTLTFFSLMLWLCRSSKD